MRLLYITDRINAADGSSVHGREFARSVRRLGHEIKTFPPLGDIYPKTASSQKRDKGPFYYLKKVNMATLLFYLHQWNGYLSECLLAIEGLFDSLKHYRKLRALFRDFMPDVIIYRQRLFNFAPYWISRRYCIPIVDEVNSLRSIEATQEDRRNKVTFVTRWGERKAIESANALFSVSKVNKDKVDHYAELSKSFVIPNGVDIEKFDPSRFDKELSKANLNLGGKTVLGYVGSYKIWHGLETSLEVVEKLLKYDTDFHLLFIGHGDQYPRIRQLITERQLNGNVTQIDSVSHNAIPEYILAFDYALMTYPAMQPFAFSPLKMFEYMAMGVPVVATNIGQIGEIITHRQTGILVSTPTVENFVSAILNERDRLMAMGNNARKLVVQQYSWRANAEKILAICDRLVSTNAGKEIDSGTLTAS